MPKIVGIPLQFSLSRTQNYFTPTFCLQGETNICHSGYSKRKQVRNLPLKEHFFRSCWASKNTMTLPFLRGEDTCEGLKVILLWSVGGKTRKIVHLQGFFKPCVSSFLTVSLREGASFRPTRR